MGDAYLLHQALDDSNLVVPASARKQKQIRSPSIDGGETLEYLCNPIVSQRSSFESCFQSRKSGMTIMQSTHKVEVPPDNIMQRPPAVEVRTKLPACNTVKRRTRIPVSSMLMLSGILIRT